MFNHDNFAGYLIWRLSPEHMPVFTDSRYDLWGSKYAKEELGVFDIWKIPLGAYAPSGEWYEFRREWTRDDVIHFITQIGKLEQFPEIQRWYESKKPYWQYILDKYNVNFIISYEGYPIDQMLRNEFHGWFLIYDDTITYGKTGGYVIYLRGTPENANLLKKLAIKFRDRIPQSVNGEQPDT